ncbi:MAG: YdhR family protein [Siculibacillus sp.]
MIVTLVQFPMPEPVSAADAEARFRSSAPHYVATPGLIRKQYLRRDDGMTLGGVYFWRDRAAAEAVYSGEWRARVAALYGVEPMITWFESSVGVDTATATVLLDTP